MPRCLPVAVRAIRNAAIILLLSGLAGCAGLRGEPERPAYSDAEIKFLTENYGPVVFSRFSELSDADRSGYRNEVINGRIALIDRYFAEYKRALLQEEAFKNIAIDLAVIGINTAGIFAPAVHVKNVLQAVSAAMIGARTKIDEAIFYRNTIIALIAKMEEQRREQELQIRRRMPEGANTYSLIAAIRDLENYYRAGTIDEALFGITKEAGAKAKDAEVEVLKIVRTASFSTPDIRRKVRSLLPVVDKLEKARAIELATNPPVALEETASAMIERTFPNKSWIADRSPDGKIAKSAIKMMIGLSQNSRAKLDIWTAELERK